jgi:hypothetical protein
LKIETGFFVSNYVIVKSLLIWFAPLEFGKSYAHVVKDVALVLVIAQVDQSICPPKTLQPALFKTTVRVRSIKVDLTITVFSAKTC